MIFRAILCGVIFCSALVFNHVSAEEPALLKPEDVQKVMGQVFSQHVDKKEISDDIIRNSFKVYIDQFDPDRVYLLESEAAPYLNLSNAKIQTIIEQYKINDFSAYEQLNALFQKAIVRARDYRKTLEREQMNFFKTHFKENEEETGYQPFASTIDELQARQKLQLEHFVDNEVNRFGEGLVKKKEAQLLSFYDKYLRAQENPYLFVDSNDKPMTAEAKQNMFIMHVIKSLASSLDAHTTFFDTSEANDLRVRLEKSIDGVGIVLKQNIDGLTVDSLLENSPAQRSGLVKVNDSLVEIDGQDVTVMPVKEAMKILQGKSGTTVALVLKRSSESSGKESIKTLNVSLKREAITINEGRAQASYEDFGNGIIGIIKLDSFYQGENGVTSEKDVREAIHQLKQKGNLRGLVLDLRENSGGFLTQAVKVAGLFITNGVVVISKYSNGDERYYRDMDGKVSYEGPMVILTSKATASAAEIVAQALQDYGVALVVGDEHTYGKGTIQSQTVTDENGKNSYFKVTVGKYYTVSGKTPQLEGVKADIVVPGPYSFETFGEEYLDRAISEDQIEPAYQDNLQDIDPGLRPWYLRYYMPTLQTKSLEVKKELSKLQKNSQYRITNNKNYQLFLKAKGQGKGGDSLASQNYGKEDPQLHETINITKDMIVFESNLEDGIETANATDTVAPTPIAPPKS